MIIVIRNDAKQQDISQLKSYILSQGLKIHESEGASTTILGLVGDTSKVDIDLLRSIDIVETVTRVQEPYKNANRKFHPQDSIIRVGDTQFGGGV
ncbi:MAG: 3-deoxy-7-phosphoheptulonate synthase, partial [Clostridia bacterium]|nr:3-deoxy-7-phosphoheptulonate synthase [Clostridia bacterium]